MTRLLLVPTPPEPSLFRGALTRSLTIPSICSWATLTSSVGPSRVILSSPSVNSMWTYQTKMRERMAKAKWQRCYVLYRYCTPTTQGAERKGWRLALNMTQGLIYLLFAENYSKCFSSYAIYFAQGQKFWKQSDRVKLTFHISRPVSCNIKRVR